MNKHSFRTTVIFSILVFVILVTTIFVTFAIMLLLNETGILKSRNQYIPFIIFAVISVILGTVLSRVIGKKPIGAIAEISNATKEIAKGNFDVRLNENIKVLELNTMAKNFNIMAKELAGIEMLRNDFIENVSHEFKTPLSAIEGYVTLLQKPSLSEETRLEYTQKILYNTKRLSALTGNILLLSRLDNQEIETKKESYSLDEQLREIILSLESSWNSKGLELDINLDTVDYYGNKDLLAHVWQNIISNAIKFADNGGRILVYLTQTQRSIIVAVSDNGVGMDDEVINRIFEKFYQGDSSRSSSGNGLGLALAKKVVDLHGGNITVSSEPGIGSTFTITLPIVENK